MSPEMMESSDSNHWQRSVPVNGAADSLPLKDVVICCTSVPDEKRTELAAYAQQLGAIHRYDLTLDVTHLIVGEYDTPKYRYVAKERPDVRPMTIEWIEAVRELWINDQEIDPEALEREHLLPILTSLKFSMTGCDDTTERLEIAEQVKANGAVYEGDLTKHITHLISFRTEGAKYRAAKSWGLRIVSIEWLRDSLERGMILDEKLYDPALPPEERGRGAWDRTKPKRTSLGKRSREDSMGISEGGKRKLRRTASTKLSSQNEKIWGDIVGGGMVMQVARSGQWETADESTARQDNEMPREESEEENPPTLINTANPQPTVNGFFGGCRFYFHGFTQPKRQILSNHLLPQGAEISKTLDEFLRQTQNTIPTRFFSVVPSDLPMSKHEVFPESNVRIDTVTEWWVERCLHHKKFMEPGEHVVGRPFPAFPIPEFREMTISSAAYSGIDLLHVTRAVELLGAKYSEDFTKHSSILLTKSTIGLRKDKLDGALEWKIPIVSASWLWDSIEAGTRLPLHKYRYWGQDRAGSVQTTSGMPSFGENPQAERSKRDLAKPSKSDWTKRPRSSGLDNTTFISDKPGPHKEKLDSEDLQHRKHTSNSTSDVSSKSEPLSEMDLNSPSRTVSTAPAPSDHPAPRPQEDISNAISDLLARSKTVAVQPLQNEAPDGRKRGGANRILGRAASNVSTASAPLSRATSVDSTATHGPAVEYPPYQPTTRGINSTTTRGGHHHHNTNEQIERFMNAGNGDRIADKDGDGQPPATQLQYDDDPESKEYKEEVMARMLGEKVDGGRRRSAREKTVTVTIADGERGVVGQRSLRTRRAREPLLPGAGRLR